MNPFKLLLALCVLASIVVSCDRSGLPEPHSGSDFSKNANLLLYESFSPSELMDLVEEYKKDKGKSFPDLIPIIQAIIDCMDSYPDQTIDSFEVKQCISRKLE